VGGKQKSKEKPKNKTKSMQKGPIGVVKKKGGDGTKNFHKGKKSAAR